ncbi:MAG: formate dehydrogenase accessory sulfurtransferase FdhD [Dehalococcoidia bacterium]
MDNATVKVSALRLSGKAASWVEDAVAGEFPVTIILNDREIVTLLCSPANLKYLAVGFLFSAGFLRSKDEIHKIMVDDRRGVVRIEAETDTDFAGDGLFKRVITSGCGRGPSFYGAADVQGKAKVESRVTVAAPDILTLVKRFQQRSQLYRETGGVHSAGLCDVKDVLVFDEDIGRHNALDKILGQCILNDIATADRIVVTSGRVSSDMMVKVARRNVPVVISKSAPTSLGLKLAADLGVTLVGFVRGRRMNVYTHDWRIIRDGK